jgi:hypothetical protein
MPAKIKEGEKILRLKIHPSAEMFPMMPDDELRELAVSIEKHGLREKLVVDTDGVLIDGRNRYRAMQLARLRIEASDITVKNFDNLPYTVDEYIVMANIERRNLTRQQRRELAGKLAVHLEKAQEEKPKAEKQDTTEAAAKAAGVSRRTAATAKQEALVKMGLREPPTKMNPPKKTTKVEQAPPRPPIVVKNLETARDAIRVAGSKWPEERRRQAIDAVYSILVTWPREAKEMLPPHLAGLFGAPKPKETK